MQKINITILYISLLLLKKHKYNYLLILHDAIKAVNKSSTDIKPYRYFIAYNH